MSEIRHIKVKCREVSVMLEYDDGPDEECVVREMNGTDGDLYMQSVQEKLTFEAGADGKFKVTGIKSFDGMYASLISRTLFHKDGKAFTDKEINALSTSAQKELFAMAQEVNAISEEAKEEAKNA